jgi:hypothetical protein
MGKEKCDYVSISVSQTFKSSIEPSDKLVHVRFVNTPSPLRYLRAEVTTTSVALVPATTLSMPGSGRHYLEYFSVESIVAMVASVLPRPITSANMPPAK